MDIPVAEILDRIAVRHPYFGFEQLKLNAAGELHGPVPPMEQPMECECGVRAAAEVGRHLAILGSCAAARLQPAPGPHYYLARKAHLRATDAYLEAIRTWHWDDPRQVELMGFAQARFEDKRTATAATRIATATGEDDLYLLDVSYSVLAPRVFERLFAEHRIENYEFDPHAYGQTTQFDDLVEDLYILDDPLLLSARFGFRPSNCAGHFPSIPALPVAILMFILSKAAGRLLGTVTGIEGVRYGVVDAKIHAENLAFPAQKLHLVVRHTGSEGGGGRHRFECSALSEGTSQEKFGEMRLTLQAYV